LLEDVLEFGIYYFRDNLLVEVLLVLLQEFVFELLEDGSRDVLSWE
jgi:hypothetical protein